MYILDPISMSSSVYLQLTSDLRKLHLMKLCEALPNGLNLSGSTSNLAILVLSSYHLMSRLRV